MPDVKTRIGNARERAMEVGVYLPLGAYEKVLDQITEIDSRKVKKFYGDLVDRGQDRVEPLEKAFRSRIRRIEREAGDKAAEVERDLKRTTRKAKASAGDAATKVGKTASKATSRTEATADAIAPKMPRVAAPKKASELPIKGYNSLTASEIATATKGLTQTDLAKVYKFEKANEDRATILEAVEAKFTELPIPSYDALTVDEINGRLEGLSESELKTIRRYEKDTRVRSTILDKLDALL